MTNPRTLKFKTILVASDLTEATSSALRYAQALALTHHATLVLVHVIDPLAYASVSYTHLDVYKRQVLFQFAGFAG